MRSRATTPLSAKTIKIGPPLYGVVDRPRASIAGFDYSGAMKAKGGTWTYDELFKFLKSPRRLYPRHQDDLRRPAAAREDRINLIAFLRTNTDSACGNPGAQARGCGCSRRLLLAALRLLLAPSLRMPQPSARLPHRLLRTPPRSQALAGN